MGLKLDFTTYSPSDHHQVTQEAHGCYVGMPQDPLPSAMGTVTVYAVDRALRAEVLEKGGVEWSSQPIHD